MAEFKQVKGKKRKILYLYLGILGLITHNHLYNIHTLRPLLKDTGLIIESPWIPIELKPVE